MTHNDVSSRDRHQRPLQYITGIKTDLLLDWFLSNEVLYVTSRIVLSVICAICVYTKCNWRSKLSTTLLPVSIKIPLHNLCVLVKGVLANPPMPLHSWEGLFKDETSLKRYLTIFPQILLNVRNILVYWMVRTVYMKIYIKRS